MNISSLTTARLDMQRALDEVKGRYAEVPKSWADFTLEQRRDAIDEVIREGGQWQGLIPESGMK